MLFTTMFQEVAQVLHHAIIKPTGEKEKGEDNNLSGNTKKGKLPGKYQTTCS